MKQFAISILAATLVFGLSSYATAEPAAGEYAKHLDALAQLSVAIGNAMPTEHWAYKPHPESMNFGQLMSHIVVTNYQFCAGLKDTAAPEVPNLEGKDSIVKFLGDSFDYCRGVIDGDPQLS